MLTVCAIAPYYCYCLLLLLVVINYQYYGVSFYWCPCVCLYVCRNDRREGGGGYRFGNSDRSGRFDDRGFGRYDDRSRYRDDDRDRDRGRRDDFDRGRYDRDRGNVATMSATDIPMCISVCHPYSIVYVSFVVTLLGEQCTFVTHLYTLF